jgi:hypothetical protein
MRKENKENVLKSASIQRNRPEQRAVYSLCSVNRYSHRERHKPQLPTSVIQWHNINFRYYETVHKKISLLTLRIVNLNLQPPNWRTTPARLPATPHSPHSQPLLKQCNLFLAPLIINHLFKKSPVSIELEDSLQCSQKPSTGPYPQPLKYSQRALFFHKIHLIAFFHLSVCLSSGLIYWRYLSHHACYIYVPS